MVDGESNHFGLAIPEFWQNFPKTIAIEQGRLVFGLFPRQSADLHEFQGGEQKTHVCYLAFGPDSVTDQPLDWCRSPAIASCTPEWYSQSQGLPFLTPRKTDKHSGYLQLVDLAIEGNDTFEKKREVIDEYGWRHFGDIYGDHEAVFHQGSAPLISHYNNQYDALFGMGVQYLRSIDPRWLRMMNELAAHVIDIDIYHTDSDKSAYNHGLFWHTFHYVDADTGTHRSYPKRGKVPPDNHPVPGGGPANEQNYTSGLMLNYFLTGNAAAREAAIGLAQWVIDMDDGQKTIFKWLSRQPTGLASKSRTPSYHGPGRGAANSISALLDGHRLTGEKRFLDKAEELIHRCIHPNDDIGARNLLDAENRWFYTMFLQSLGKYLLYKAERGDLDHHYAYARAALLHYTRWMVDHEYPYLAKPHLLEYPTETWAAQDMRKSEIFKLAALCSQAEERQRFIERADFFFNYSVEKLQTMPTRSLCRPVVLMLNFGYMHAWFKQHSDASFPPAPIENPDFGTPTNFVPQKTIALRRAKWIVVIVSIMLLLGLIALGYRVFF
jgi:hypothetical protein